MAYQYFSEKNLFKRHKNASRKASNIVHFVILRYKYTYKYKYTVI